MRAITYLLSWATKILYERPFCHSFTGIYRSKHLSMLAWLNILVLWHNCPLLTNTVLALDDKTYGNIPHSEYDALWELYNATNGADWNWEDLQPGDTIWDFTEPHAHPCQDQWAGIDCFQIGSPPQDEYYIQDLVLIRRNLQGTIPHAIANLTRLQVLSLPSNHLNGTIPSTIGHFANLSHLDLGLNNLTGLITSELVSGLQNLRLLKLGRNNLNGSLPNNWGILTSMQELGLGFNQFTGTIPASLFDLSQLRSLDLVYCPHMHGTIPTTIGETMVEIQQILLTNMTLHGTLPNSLGNLTKMLSFYVNENFLTGTVPASLGNWSEYCVDLALDVNLLDGSLPTTLSQLTRVHFLGISRNRISGTIPEIFQNMTELRILYLDNNRLHGSIPDTIGKIHRLEILSLFNNFLTGPIPSNIGDITALTTVYVQSNLLEGTVPTSLSNCSFLTTLFLQNNQLTGSVENVFNATLQNQIDIINLSDNQFTGDLPASVFTSPNLASFLAVSNCFSGFLPEEICQASQLTTLSLDGIHTASSCHGQLLPSEFSSSYQIFSFSQGTFPACLFTMERLTTLHLSGNGLTGTLPADVSISENLIDLVLSHNFLSGTIPANIQLKNWYHLDLSYNKLGGRLMAGFASNYSLLDQNLSSADLNQFLFKFSHSNISYDSDQQLLSLENNQLSGMVPATIFDRESISILQGNLFQCNLQKSNIPKHDSDYFQYQCGSDSFDYPYYAFLSVFMLMIVAVITTFIMVQIYRRNRRQRFHPPLPSDQLEEEISTSSYSSSSSSSSPSSPSHQLTITEQSIEVLRRWLEAPYVIAAKRNRQEEQNLLLRARRRVARRRRSQVPVQDQQQSPQEQQWGDSQSDGIGSVSSSSDISTKALPMQSLSAPANITRLGRHVNKNPLHDGDNSNNARNSSGDDHNNNSHSNINGPKSNNAEEDGRFSLWLMRGRSATNTSTASTRPHSSSSSSSSSSFAAASSSVLSVPSTSHSSAETSEVTGSVSIYIPETLSLAFTSGIFNLVDGLCNVAKWAGAYILLILLPIYAIVGVYYGTHVDQYAWTVAAVFTSGVLPLAVELPFFFVFLCLCTIVYLTNIRPYTQRLKPMQREVQHRASLYQQQRFDDNNNDDDGGGGGGGGGGGMVYEESIKPKPSDEKDEDDVTLDHNSSVHNQRGNILRNKILIWGLFITLNFTVVVGVNISFVLAAMYGTSQLLVIAQLLLAGFKMLWNSFCAPFLMRIVTMLLYTYQQEEDGRLHNKQQLKAGVFALLLFVALCNNIIVPCIVVAVISPNCFYNLFEAASEVTSRYNWEDCAIIGFEKCELYIPAVGTTSYNPPFTYSYQCSASIVTYYAPAFIYYCITKAFLIPALQSFAMWWLERFTPGTPGHRLLHACIPRLLRPVLPTETDIARDDFRMFFDTDRLLLSIFTQLGLLLTFGVVFPPLAAAQVLGIYGTATFMKLKVGRLLTSAFDQRLFEYITMVERECREEGSIMSLKHAWWMILSVSAGFYTLFLFDTLGNAKDFAGAYWVLIVVPMLPLCIYCVYRMYRYAHGANLNDIVDDD